MSKSFAKLYVTEEVIDVELFSLRDYATFLSLILKKLNAKYFYFYPEWDYKEIFIPPSITSEFLTKEIIEYILALKKEFYFQIFEDFLPFVKDIEFYISISISDSKMPIIGLERIIFKNREGVDDLIYFILRKISSIGRKIEGDKEVLVINFDGSFLFWTRDFNFRFHHDGFLEITERRKFKKLNKLAEIIKNVLEEMNLQTIEDD